MRFSSLPDERGHRTRPVNIPAAPYIADNVRGKGANNEDKEDATQDFDNGDEAEVGASCPF